MADRSVAEVDTAVVEVVVTAEAARELTDRIRICVDTAWELIKQAYVSRVWVVLDYGSWDEYCAQEFDRARIRIPREERPEVVASLREIGMSTRAIAAATGVSDFTVRQDLAGARNLAPDRPGACDDGPVPVLGEDGKTYPSPNPRQSRVEGDESRDDVERKSRRKPLPDAFWQAGIDARKAVERVERLVADDRFDRNAEQITSTSLADLVRARDALGRVIDRMSSMKSGV
ncbi:hypothetical protein [Nocardia arthritidis]|uniref:Uncharacterized protein n=1 Tax=Nocardia arthritidis TaxID=228602 RepID=A0A6G9YC93_9NOCA|nr:hypothetical protein [Nocardia arthritidis]QIS10633.1 hypothetical protein F5544_13725 [Nocardia arthritidis]